MQMRQRARLDPSLARSLVCSVVLACALPASAAEPMKALIDRTFEHAALQYDYLLKQVEKTAREPGPEGAVGQVQDKARTKPFPRTFENHALRLVGPLDWTSGFVPGSLWYLSEATGQAKWRKAAIAYTAATAPAKFDKTQHDLGFMLYCGYGNGYRLSPNPAYRDALLAGATTLVTRFNPKVGAIQSWDPWPNTSWKFPVIVDNMMNLELLMWAARTSGDTYYRQVAIAHADTTIRHHYRPDGSSYHLVDYDPADGKVRARVTVQGHADASAWARGQAWGLYGYTMMYRETRDPAYLAQARRAADFYLGHARLPQDKVPYWDFDDPAIPDAPRDAAAAAITSSALIELSGFVDAAPGRAYLQAAEQTLRSLASPQYLARVGENGGFLLKHATGHKPAGTEIDVPLNYADYYFLEGLLRYRALSHKGRAPRR